MSNPNGIADAVNAILRELNGGNAKAIALEIHRSVIVEHRTIQQQFWSALLLAQIRYAGERHDLRNEQAVELARLVKAAAEQHNMDQGLRYV